MRNLIVLILTVFVLSLFGNSSEPENVRKVTYEKESLMKANPSNAEQSLERLSRDLKSSNFLAPRRNVQNFQQNQNIRIFQSITRLLHDSRLKGEQELCKVLQFNSYCLTIKLSSLLCRKGYHIYALRKILI
ncbi:MAG: hypothetical protein LIP01_01535 [Tannerellaceae bacterium]|nr:hypothetical protein [Tannerellaceae bacterium]